MVDSTPQHGAIFVKLLAQDLLARGFKEAQVFDKTGVTKKSIEGEKPVLAFGKVAAFYENAAKLTGDDLLGFKHGWNCDPRQSGLISYVGLASPTLLHYLKNTARFRRVFTDAIEINLDTLDCDGVLDWHFAVPSSVKRRQYVESCASDLIWSLRKCTNREIQLEQVSFSHARKTNIDEFKRFFGCETQFGAKRNTLRFKLSDLGLPLITADNELHKILTAYCEDVLQAKSKNPSNLIVKVERAITERLATGEATQVEVAKSMGMSQRTLSRRLSVEKTTYFKTLEGLRKSLAFNYLRDSDFVLSEIAYLLGYSGPGSFSDAFKRWTGHTPGRYQML